MRRTKIKKYPFRIFKNSFDQIVLQNTAKTVDDAALFPYINIDIDFISITKGENHVCNIIKDNGKCITFCWGHDGYTIISSSLESLKQKACEFITSQGIALSVKTTMQPCRAVIRYNNFVKCWQATLFFPYNVVGEEHYFNNSVSNQTEMLDLIKKVFNKDFSDLKPWSSKMYPYFPVWVTHANNALDFEYHIL